MSKLEVGSHQSTSHKAHRWLCASWHWLVGFAFPRHAFPTHASRAGAQWPVPPVSETSVGPARAVTSSSYYLAAYLIFTDDRSHLAARLVLYRVVRGVAWMKGVNVPIKWGGRHQFSALPIRPLATPTCKRVPKNDPLPSAPKIRFLLSSTGFY